jgi:hypothetical protein
VLRRMTFDDAEAHCTNNGSHLISYSNSSTQQFVETSLIDAGLLLPAFHKSYWIGLNTTLAAWPATWTWVDSRPYVRNVTYQNWGVYQPGNLAEPNNVTGSEACAVANTSQPRGPTWGWSDTNCMGAWIFMCYYARA